MRSLRHITVGILLGATVASCSSFERDWESAAAIEPPDAISGRWSGKWKSDANGHSGGLRCIASRIPDTDRYALRFLARWGGVFTFEYTVEVAASAEPEPDRIAFTGEEDLGLFAGGHYEYVGEVADGFFRSTYTTRGDNGFFEMRRPEDATTEPAETQGDE